jgi:hypothetical protein
LIPLRYYRKTRRLSSKNQRLRELLHTNSKIFWFALWPPAKC